MQIYFSDTAPSGFSSVPILLVIVNMAIAAGDMLESNGGFRAKPADSRSAPCLFTPGESSVDEADITDVETMIIGAGPVSRTGSRGCH